jgi:ABC-type lipoprotein export system ATPase subunit
MNDERYARGAEWRQWDLHIHSPASFEWKGKHLWEMSEAEVRASMDAMIAAMNEAEPTVFTLMDYWTFDGWLALKRRLAEPGAPKLEKVVFPGIELRLVAPTNYRLNAHVVFADDITEQELVDFKSKLEVALIDQPLSAEVLRRLAREKLGADLLLEKGIKAADVIADDEVALIAGSKCAEVTLESYKVAIAKVPNDKAIGFIPWDTSDGLAKADWKKHYAYVLGLMKASPIFETRRDELWAAFVGVETEDNKAWFKNFQAALDETPRLAVSGSDAHSYARYGAFPSGKVTWLKTDPTFLGLKQAIKEPAKRSYIGEKPPKLQEVEGNKTYYIDQVEISKDVGCSFDERWLENCRLSLNFDLVAIIGNKGSGKSALADAIALLGNSRQKEHFSFLSSKRFRAKPKEYAKHFSGRLTWKDATDSGWRPLSEDPPTTSVELVRYIPQAHFEKLCNDHVSGRSDVFENELRSVIFSHTSQAIRQKALDFNQLVEMQEASLRAQLGEYRKDLRRLNQEIETMEAHLQPEKRQSLGELLLLKEKQIEEHKKLDPGTPKKPSEELSPEQLSATEQLDLITKRLNEIEAQVSASLTQEAAIGARSKAVQAVKERLRLLERQHKQFAEDVAAELAVLGLKATDIVALKVTTTALDSTAGAIPAEQQSLFAARQALQEEAKGLRTKQSLLNAQLNAPQQKYQRDLKTASDWAKKLSELIGAADAPDTLEGIKARLLQLDNLPAALKSHEERRLKLAGDIFETLDTQRKARAGLFEPVQQLVQGNALIREDYKLQFQATLGGSADALAAALFALIKNNTGEFRGEEEAFGTVRKLAEQCDFSIKESVLELVQRLHQKILEAVHGAADAGIGIASILRGSRSPSGANKTPCDVYDLIYGLSFLEPRYSLLFQDTQIEQLSPGQRGALLLIFYLLVDKGQNPIILDQPEENLDNQTVFSLLVPVLSEAKKKRQIIMVTHNPNLAVVCDAEQVIYSSFDRKGQCTISYHAGAIENPVINRHVVDVLEGTKVAFDNRQGKYH